VGSLTAQIIVFDIQNQHFPYVSSSFSLSAQASDQIVAINGGIGGIDFLVEHAI
jgi:hypothetical protein